MAAPDAPADVVPPIVVTSGGDILLFDRVSAAEAYLEAIDVRNGEYDGAYDAVGRQLVLEVHDEAAAAWLPLRAERVRIVRGVMILPEHEFVGMLQRYLAVCGVSEEKIHHVSRQDLLNLVREHAGRT